MKQQTNRVIFRGLMALLVLGITASGVITPAYASGGSGSGGGGGVAVDTIKVSKCYTTAGPGYVELLLKASSSDPAATLSAYLPSGTYLGQVQNGGGGRYGGTPFLAPAPPASITFKSSSGGSITVPTTPFQL